MNTIGCQLGGPFKPDFPGDRLQPSLCWPAQTNWVEGERQTGNAISE